MSTLTSQADFDSAKSTELRLLQPPSLPQDKLSDEFYYNLTEQQLADRRKQCFAVSEEDIMRTVEKYIHEPIISDKSSKVIFGLKENKLEGFVSRGWKIEKYFAEISLNMDRYNSGMDVWSEKVKEYH